VPLRSLLEPERRPSRQWLIAIATALMSAAYGGYQSWSIQLTRTLPLDLDGWGELARRIAASGQVWSVLFGPPSLWKGPVVPFIFGTVYAIWPRPESILVFNVLCFTLASLLLALTSLRLGAPPIAVVIALLAWIVYPPHSYVYGYYLAEPVVVLASTVTFVLFVSALRTRRLPYFLAAGVSAGLLVLMRAPFILVVAGMVIMTFITLRRTRPAAAGCLVLGILISYVPWPVRNYVHLGWPLPFTMEGGKILFQGVYIAADDAQSFVELRKRPEFARLEKAASRMPPRQEYVFWQRLAFDEIRRDPPGQLVLIVRKTVRFRVDLPNFTWVPRWKTAVAAAISLPLAFFGAWATRQQLLTQVAVLWVGGLWVFHGIVRCQQRYNFPVLPLLFLLSMLGALTLYQRWQSRRALAVVEPHSTPV
jgi:hypothetical protein